MFQAERTASAKALRPDHAWYVWETWRRLVWLEQSHRGGDCVWGGGDEDRDGTGQHVQGLVDHGEDIDFYSE